MEPNKKRMESKRLDISIPDVQKAVAGLLKLSKISNKKSDILEDQQKVHLVITMKKIPNMPKVTINMNLPHGLLTPDTDVCLFVKDIDKASREFELSEDHFRDMLMDKGVNCVRKVIPLKALKLEYKPYEAKRNLSNEFDVFLADARIVRLLPSLLGKNFYGRKRNPIQVNLKAIDLKKEISKAVNSTRCVIQNKGSSSMVTIGHSKQTQENIVENILKAVDQLIKKFPGGPDNIRSLHIKTGSSMSIPLYVTLDTGDSVVFPERKRTKNKQVTEEITTVVNAKVRVTADGRVKVVKSNVEKNQNRKRKSSENEDKESGAKEEGTADGEEVEIKTEYDSQEEGVVDGEDVEIKMECDSQEDEPILKKAKKTPKKGSAITPGGQTPGSKLQKKTPKSGNRKNTDSVKKETPKISKTPEIPEKMATPKGKMKTPQASLDKENQKSGKKKTPKSKGTPRMNGKSTPILALTPSGKEKKTPKLQSSKKEKDGDIKVKDEDNENVQTMQTPASVIKSKAKTPKTLKMDKTPKSASKEKGQAKTPKSATIEKAAKKLKTITPPKVKRLQSNVKVLTPDTPTRKQKKK